MKIIFQTDDGKLCCERGIEGLTEKQAYSLMFDAIESLGTHKFCDTCDGVFLEANIINVDGLLECPECYKDTIDAI